MNAEQIRAMVAAQNLPAVPISASEGLRRDDLSLRLLVEIACQLADLNARLAKGAQ